MEVVGVYARRTSENGDYMEAEKKEQTYPSVDLAYQIAIASYDSAVKRLDTIDGRIQTILAFIVSITVAVPSIGGARGISFNSGWFISALVATVAAIGIGIYARLVGDIQLLSPARLYDGWLHLPESEFKKNLIYCAGQDFRANTALVQRKWNLMVWVIILFLLEALGLLVWVLSRHP
jgi:hypothetical protein